MGNNRLQYQLLHKNSVQWKSINTKMGLCNISRGKAKVLQQKQLSQETFRNLTPSRRSERIKSGRIVKPKICKIKKPKIAPDNKSTTSVEQVYQVTLPRSVPTLLVDLRKPLNKWDIGSNPLRQEFNSEINSAFKSMRNIIDEIE
ncbi:10650_t:CDS:2 [Rhizophagus irregularis]|nr:10650_t:CDS:2 [Rhizophagus irregularis]